MEGYHKLLDTIQIVAALVSLETTSMTEHGPVVQTIWEDAELKGIKKQLLGLMKEIPAPAYFRDAKE